MRIALVILLMCSGCAQPVVKKSFTTAPPLSAVESFAQGNAVAPGQPVTLTWDSSNTEFRIYTSLDKVQWVRGMTVHTNVAVVNASLPQWFRVTAVEGSLESFPSNKLLVVGKTNGIVVTGEHAATPDGPWQTYEVPVFSGPASESMHVFRVKAQTQSGWQTVSEP